MYPSSTYRYSSRSAKLPLQAIWEYSWYTRLIWVIQRNDTRQSKSSRDKCVEQDGTETRLEVGVWLGREDAQDVVVLVKWFTVVSALLLVPPVVVWVTERTLDRWWIRVASIL